MRKRFIDFFDKINGFLSRVRWPLIIPLVCGRFWCSLIKEAVQVVGADSIVEYSKIPMRKRTTALLTS